MQPRPSKPRVCAVSYLNTAPLVWGMLHGPQRDAFELSFAVPSVCAARLAEGAVDIGIVPVVEMARQGLAYLPSPGIACRGAVRSILLVSKVPPQKIRTLAVDRGSRTSVMLARVVLLQRYGAAPLVVSEPPELARMLASNDAALVIGDPALLLDPQRLPYHTLDLGAEWFDLTGLPMVFALWAGPATTEHAGLAEVFEGSLRYGQEHISEVAAAEAPKRGISLALARKYLTEHIVFEISAREAEGLHVFLRYAAELDPAIEAKSPLEISA